jgi:hypothetical protein
MNLSSECDGFACDPAKVEDQVQFLARTLEKCDAGARRRGDCLQSSFKWVRLPPASLKATKGIGWHRRMPAARLRFAIRFEPLKCEEWPFVSADCVPLGRVG